jgi:hypothetical protein
MNSLFFHHERLQSNAYLAKLHSKDPNPYGSPEESVAHDRRQQPSPIEHAKLAHLLNQRLGHELSTR